MSGTNRIPGRFVRLEVLDPSVSGQYVKVGGIITASLAESVSEDDATDTDCETEVFLEGLGSWTMDLDANWVNNDPGQTILLEAMRAKIPTSFRYYLLKQHGATLRYWEGSMFRTSRSMDGGIGTIAKFPSSWRCNNVQELDQAGL